MYTQQPSRPGNISHLTKNMQKNHPKHHESQEKSNSKKTSSKKTCQTNLDLRLFAAWKNTSNNLLQGGVFFHNQRDPIEKIHKKSP